MHWNPTPADMKTIRTAAAARVGMKPRQIALAPSLRMSLDDVGSPSSFNDLEWGRGVKTDLYDNSFTFTDMKAMGGVPMNAEGEALLHVNVYQLGNHGYGIERVELLDVVEVSISSSNGSKPVLQEVS